MPDDPRPTPSQELRRLRTTAGWSIEELAKRIRVGPERLRQWETGELPIPPRKADAIVRVLYLDRQDDILRRSGLPTCQWMEKWEFEGKGASMTAAGERFAELQQHVRECEICRRREGYLREHLGDPPLTLYTARPAAGWKGPLILGLLLALVLTMITIFLRS